MIGVRLGLETGTVVVIGTMGGLFGVEVAGYGGGM
jgi:hypothetical protein